MPLNPSIQRHAGRIRAALTEANRRLLDQTLALVDDRGEANLADVLAALFPGETPARAIKKYAKLREAIGIAAGKINLKFELETDGRTRTAHAGRITWFSAEGRVQEAATEGMLKPEIAGLGPVVPPVGVQFDESRRPVRYFLVWAHEDEALKRRLVKALQPYSSAHPRFRLRLAADLEISPEATWSRSAQREMRTCELGLILTGPALLASRFTTVPQWKRAIK